MKRKNHALPFLFAKKEEIIGKDVGAYLKYAEKRKETDIFMTALYETWTFQQEVPGLIQDLLNRLQKQKTSTKASDCSQYNTCRAKSATLHAPTLRAILWLLLQCDLSQKIKITGLTAERMAAETCLLFFDGEHYPQEAYALCQKLLEVYHHFSVRLSVDLIVDSS